MSTFFSNILKLVSGNIIAQILGILLVPVITRLYIPSDFGVFQLFLSISSIIVIFSCFSYNLAIMLPKDDEDSATIVALCLILITIISIISGSIFIIFSDLIGKVLNAPDISQYFIYLPLLVFLNGLFVVLNYWLSRRKRFGIIATAQVANSVSSRAVQISFGIVSPSALGLITGIILGYTASLTVFLRQIRCDFPLFKAVTLQGIRNLAIRYKRFPLFTSWSSGANVVSTQIAPLFLAFFFSRDIVGYYSMANMVVLLPMGLIGYATSQVFFQKACDEKNRTGSVTNIVKEIQSRLISLGMFPMFMLIIIGADLFSFVLGSRWYTAGEYAGILAPWLLFVFIASPLSTIFSVLEKQTIDLTFNLLILISRFFVLILGGLYGSPVVTLIFYSATGVLFFGWMNLYLLKISGISYQTGLKDYLKFFCLSLVIALPLVVIKLLSVPPVFLFICVGIASLIYYTIIAVYDPILKNEILGIFRGYKL